MDARTRNKPSPRRAPREDLGTLAAALRPLNERQRKFVRHLLSGKSASVAADLAGYRETHAVVMLRGLAKVREAIHRLAPLAADPAVTEAMLRPYALEALAETLADKKGSKHTRVTAAREVLAPTGAGRATPPALLPRTSTTGDRGTPADALRTRTLQDVAKRRAAARQAAGLADPPAAVAAAEPPPAPGRTDAQVEADLAAQAEPLRPAPAPLPLDVDLSQEL